MRYRTLGDTALRVSLLGFGAASLGEEYGPIDEEEGFRAVHEAIDQGINFFDTSPYYGRTLAEERLGRALEGRRDEVVLATKGGRHDVDRFDFSASGIRSSLEASLRRLRTDVIDVYQAHDVEFGAREQVLNETIPVLQELKREGKVRAVGITGLPLQYLRGLVEESRGLDVVLSYAHYNLMADDLDRELLPIIRKRKMGLINASPLHLGILTDQGPQEWHQASPEAQRVGRAIAALCRERGENVARVALRFALDHDYVATTLVSMGDRDQVRRNVSVVDAKGSSALLAEIEGLVAPVKNESWVEGRPENNP